MSDDRAADAPEATGRRRSGRRATPTRQTHRRGAAGRPAATPAPPLERHSPFYIGFFGGLGALLAFWLGTQLLAISSVLILVVVAMFLAVGLNPVGRVLRAARHAAL